MVKKGHNWDRQNRYPIGTRRRKLSIVESSNLNLLFSRKKNGLSGNHFFNRNRIVLSAEELRIYSGPSSEIPESIVLLHHPFQVKTSNKHPLQFQGLKASKFVLNFSGHLHSILQVHRSRSSKRTGLVERIRHRKTCSKKARTIGRDLSSI